MLGVNFSTASFLSFRHVNGISFASSFFFCGSPPLFQVKSSLSSGHMAESLFRPCRHTDGQTHKQRKRRASYPNIQKSSFLSSLVVRACIFVPPFPSFIPAFLSPSSRQKCVLLVFVIFYVLNFPPSLPLPPSSSLFSSRRISID